MLVGCPCTHIRCGYFWVDDSRCWAASKPSAVSFLNSSLSLQLLLTSQEKQYRTSKQYQESGSILTAYLSAICSKDRQTLQGRSLWFWSKKKIGEKELPFYRCCQNPHPPFCHCCEVVLNCRRTPGCLFPCSHQMPSSFPVVYSSGKSPALLWWEESLLGWILQGGTFLTFLSWADNKLTIVQSLCGVLYCQGQKYFLEKDYGEKVPILFKW